jgi:hypothetical protein
MAQLSIAQKRNELKNMGQQLINFENNILQCRVYKRNLCIHMNI